MNNSLQKVTRYFIYIFLSLLSSAGSAFALDASDSTSTDLTSLAGDLAADFGEAAALQLPSGQKMLLKWRRDVNAMLMFPEKTDSSTIASAWRTFSEVENVSALKVQAGVSSANFFIIISDDVEKDREKYRNLVKAYFKDSSYDDFISNILRKNLFGDRIFLVTKSGELTAYLLLISTSGCRSETGLKACLHTGILTGFGLAGIPINNYERSPDEMQGGLAERDKQYLKILYDKRLPTGGITYK